MQETKKITAGLDVRLNKLASLYHCIISFLELIQGGNETTDTFKLRWDNADDIVEMSKGENILRSDQLIKVDGDQESSK